MPERIALLGGTGCGGRAVASALRDAGHDVLVISRGHTGPQPDIACDRNDHARLSRALGRFRPDTLVDHVAYTPDEVRGVLGALPRTTRRYLFVSSAVVYGPGRADGYGEEESPRPVGEFAVTKRAAEEAALAWAGGDRTVVCARLGGLYGPGHAPLMPWGRAESVLERLRRAEQLPVPAHDDATLQPWFAGDHGRAVARLVDHAEPPGRINLAGEQRLSWPDALAAWAEAIGAPAPRVLPITAEDLASAVPPAIRQFASALFGPQALRTARMRRLLPELFPTTPVAVGYARVAADLGFARSGP